MRSASGPIAIFVTQLESGGAQWAAARLTRGLRDSGRQARLFFLYAKHPVDDLPVDFTVVSRLTPRHVFFLPDLAIRLIALFFTIRPASTISFTHYANVVVQPLAALMGVRRRIASQRNVSDSYPAIARLLDRVCGTSGVYTHNVMVSQSVQRSFGDRPRSYLARTCVIPNGCEPPTLPRPAPLSRRTVIAAGRLSPQKNHAVLIHMLPLIPDVDLLILGEGELRDHLQNLAFDLAVGGRVTFGGTITNAALIGMIAQADVFALPSRHEGMSNVLLEALFSDTPIVASDIEENREVLALGSGQYAGLLAPPDQPTVWAAHITNLLHTPALARSYVELANTRAHAFHLTRMVERFDALLAEDHVR